MSAKKEYAVYPRPVIQIVNGKFSHETEPVRVRVLVTAEGYAMVRRKGGVPFVVTYRDLLADDPTVPA